MKHAHGLIGLLAGMVLAGTATAQDVRVAPAAPPAAPGALHA